MICNTGSLLLTGSSLPEQYVYLDMLFRVFFAGYNLPHKTFLSANMLTMTATPNSYKEISRKNIF